jgi:outer membrane protein assembly factor BamB
MTAPRWEISTDSSILALAPRTDGGAATLDEHGRALLVDVSSQTTASLVLTTSTKPDSATPTALQEIGARGWLVSVAEAKHLVRVSGSERSVVAKGDSVVAGFRVSGDQVAVAREESVDYWNLTGQLRWQHEGGPFLAVTVVGKTVVALKADGEIEFLAVMTGSVTGRMKLEVPEAASTWHLAAVEGSRFALGLGDFLVIVDAAKEKVFRRTRMRTKITSLAANERRVLVGLDDGWIQVVDPLTGDARGALETHRTAVRAVGFGKGVVLTTAHGEPLRVWDEAQLSGAPVASSPVSSLSARGALVAVGTKAGRARILKGVEEVGSTRLGGPASFVHVAEDESVLAVSASLVVRLEKPWKTPKPLVLETTCTAFAADDAYVFSGNDQGTVDVFDLDTCKKLTSYELSDGTISALARPRGVHLVVGTDALDGRVFVVDVAEAAVVHRIEAHQDAFGVTCLAAEPRGRLVASGSDDGTVALIDLAKGRVLARLTVAEAPVSLTFDATGKRLFVASSDGAVTAFALDQKGKASTVEVPKTTCVAWSNGLVCGLFDGRVEHVKTS